MSLQSKLEGSKDELLKKVTYSNCYSLFFIKHYLKKAIKLLVLNKTYCFPTKFIYLLFIYYLFILYHLLFIIIFTRECNETSIAGARRHSLTRSLDFVKYFIYGNYNVPY